MRYSCGTFKVPLKYSLGTVKVQLKYSWGTVKVQFRYSGGTVGARLKYNWGTVVVQIKYIWGTVKEQLTYIWGTVVCLQLFLWLLSHLILSPPQSISTLLSFSPVSFYSKSNQSTQLLTSAVIRSITCNENKEKMCKNTFETDTWNRRVYIFPWNV